MSDVSSARHLVTTDLGCWLLKSSRPASELSPGWLPGEEVTLRRCLSRSYRLGVMRTGHCCVLWVSGSRVGGVHALGHLLGPPSRGDGTEPPSVDVALRLLSRPLPRPHLLACPELADAEVLRMPAGSNPSFLTSRQLAALSRLVDAGEEPQAPRPPLDAAYRAPAHAAASTRAPSKAPSPG